MNFDKQNIADCVIPVIPDPPPSRCTDSGYALAHPEECPSALIIKPSFVNLCNLGSMQFEVFEFRNGLEVPVTAGLAFNSSTPAVFTIGVNSGSGTALSVGDSVITVIKIADGRSARATITVLAEDGCCDDVAVATSIVLDISNSSRLPFGGSHATRLDFAKAMAKHYSDPILLVDSLPKDLITLWKLDTEALDVMGGFSTDSAQIAASIDSVQQGTRKTDLLLLFTRVTEELVSDTPSVAPPVGVPAVVGNIDGYVIPLGNVVPAFVNQFYRWIDAYGPGLNSLWQSTGLTVNDWVQWV